MSTAHERVRQTRQPTFAELYVPKLVTVLREGYGLADLRADVTSGLTVAIVALPLSMAIAIASGVTPDRGLYTAVVGGFIVSLLGGSRSEAVSGERQPAFAHDDPPIDERERRVRRRASVVLPRRFPLVPSRRGQELAQIRLCDR